ncbi:MAG: dephospho-CoA kinase [Burkholderiaceae bacterium]|nr:dephospho-CoA kinase [Burkholderiaceae bacterium]
MNGATKSLLRPDLLTIGLTGGIGSGKTRVADQLALHGASVIDTDLLAHALTAPGGEAMATIEAAFGSEAVSADGAMDRTWMRARVFDDPPARQRLEAILHPMIGAAAQTQARAATGPYLVFVVPLLVESGRWSTRVNRVCVVDCEPDTQIARVQTRSGLTPQTIRRIMATQASRSDRLAAAHDVIDNGAHVSTEQLTAAVTAQHRRWLAMAADAHRTASQLQAANPAEPTRARTE